jgi:glycosyltransferase involved in cell wall biosynthesis
MPGWIDMGLSTLYYFFLSLFIRTDMAFCVKPYPMSVPALWVQRLKGAKVVFDVDDVDDAYSHGLFRKFHHWLQKPWPRWADLVTYHNPLLKEHLLADFNVPDSKIRRVPQGVDDLIFNTLPLRKSDLPSGVEYWKAARQGPLLCFTAHLNVACDLGPALKAFRLILASSPTARLLVAGGGPDEEKFTAQARMLQVDGSIFFTGLITPRQVAACLKLSDAVLVYYSDNPANRHRSSMKLREALACGLKVVATRVGEAANWKKGLFPSPADPQGFAQAVLGALKSKKIPREGLLLVKKWSWKNCVTALEEEITGS